MSKKTIAEMSEAEAETWINAFRGLMQRWHVNLEDAAHLMAMPAEDHRPMWSALAGIYLALHTLHGEELADRWVYLPNNNPLFAGGTPMAYMVREGVSGALAVRRLLEARVNNG